MTWEILFHPEFEEWFDRQEDSFKEALASVLDVLEEEGPLLGRPYVDTIKESSFGNMKEIRVQCQGRPWRVLVAFDPLRQAVVLVGGHKGGDKRWYKENVSLADKRFQQHLEKMKRR
jgi:hypothetical protein